MTNEEWRKERLRRDQARLRELNKVEHDKAVQRCLDSWIARSKQ